MRKLTFGNWKAVQAGYAADDYYWWNMSAGLYVRVDVCVFETVKEGLSEPVSSFLPVYEVYRDVETFLEESQ